MNKTKIEWADYTWNPVTGCLHGCPYCYARGVATRFNGGYGERGEIHVVDEPLRDHWRDEDAGKVVEGPKAAYPYGFDPTFHRYKLDEPGRKAKGAVIFVGSMTDLFGDWVPQEWIEAVFWACQQAPQHTYLFLTKNPGRLMDLAEAGKLPTFDNFWYGSTTTTPDTPFFWSGLHHTFVSVEPILAPFIMATNKVEWAIFGAECWESALARDALKEEPDLRAACTTCALTAGTNTNQGGDQHGQDPTNPREHPAHGKGRV